MAYWRLYYHLVWATKHRQPLITTDVESALYDFLRTKAVQLGATVFAVNGVADHVHLVAAIPPSVAVAILVGQVKGAGAWRLNGKQSLPAPHFSWQDGYGAFSCDAKRLPYVIDYVDRQKEHHATAKLIPVLESIEEAKPPRVREEAMPYLVDQERWWRDMLRDVGSAGG